MLRGFSNLCHFLDIPLQKQIAEVFLFAGDLKADFM